MSYLPYWTAFKEYLAERGSAFQIGKPQPHNWMDFSIGTRGCKLQTVVHTKDQWLCINLMLLGPQAQTRFEALYAARFEIEGALGSLGWDTSEQATRSIWQLIRAVDPQDVQSWPQQFGWLAARLELFKLVFGPRLFSGETKLV